MKIRYILGYSALGVAIVVAGATAANSAGGLPDFGATAAESPAPGVPSIPSAPTAAAAPTASPAPDSAVSAPVRFAVAGDSITAWSGQEAGSWTSYVGTDGIEFTGLGWALNGAPLAMMEENIGPVDADVLVILGGTNDLVDAPPIAGRLALVDAIAENAGIDDIVISAVPPFTPRPAAAITWNAALRAHADDKGYTFVDPWSTSLEADGTFEVSKTVDGIHPTPRTAAAAAVLIRRAVIAAAD